MDNANDLNAWVQMLQPIAHSRGSWEPEPRGRRADPKTGAAGAPPASSTGKVRLLDRPTATTAILSWSDPTACHYEYQGWRVSKAERYGICALSGLPISKGDEVYRPRASTPRPRNAKAMILRRVLERESCVALQASECP